MTAVLPAYEEQTEVGPAGPEPTPRRRGVRPWWKPPTSAQWRQHAGIAVAMVPVGAALVVAGFLGVAAVRDATEPSPGRVPSAVTSEQPAPASTRRPRPRPSPQPAPAPRRIRRVPAPIQTPAPTPKPKRPKTTTKPKPLPTPKPTKPVTPAPTAPAPEETP